MSDVQAETNENGEKVISYYTDRGRKKWQVTISAGYIIAQYRVPGIDQWYVEGMIDVPDVEARQAIAKALSEAA